MRVISRKALLVFWEKHSDAELPLQAWFKETSKSHWANFPEIKATFNATDVYGSCFIFDIGGNKYRLIAKINFKTQLLFVKSLMLHKDYDKGKWKDEC